jgi:hypothetical protein
MADTPTVLVGAQGSTDAQQQKVSDDLKAAAAGRASREAVGRTIRVRARSGRPNGHYRAGQRLPGPPAPGEDLAFAEFDTTEEGIALLMADPSVFVDIDGADPDELRDYRSRGGVKWPPEGMTPHAHMRMRLAIEGTAPADAMDSTGKSLRTGERPAAGDRPPPPSPKGSSRKAAGDEKPEEKK